MQLPDYQNTVLYLPLFAPHGSPRFQDFSKYAHPVINSGGVVYFAAGCVPTTHEPYRLPEA